MLAFTQPWLLWGLLALAAPIILHLVNRRPARRWAFSSLRFLQPAPLPRQGRRRLSDPLLLLLRLLAFAALILLSAGPRWVQAVDPAQQAPTQLLLVDVSASMGGWGALQEAKEQLAHFLRDQPPGPIGLIAFADAIVLQQSPTLDRALLRQTVENLQPTLFAVQPENAFTAAMALPGNQDFLLHIWSDFQRSGWESVAWPELPREQLHLHPVATSRNGNIAILQAQSYPRDTEILEVLVFVRNDDNQARTFNLELQWEGGTVRQPVELAAGETSPVVLHIPIPRNPVGLVRIPEDAFAADNSFYLYLGPPPPTRVLALRPASNDPAVMEEIFFLGTALETFTGSEPIRFLVDALGTSLLSVQSLARYDAVILNSHTLLTDAVDVQALDGYVQQGGTVFLTLGEQPSAALQALRGTAVGGLRHEGTTGRQLTNLQRDAIASLPGGSRLLETFEGEAARDLYLADLFTFHMLQGALPESVLLHSERGYPLLMDIPSGSGRWILSALPLHTRATDLPLRNAFLPLVKSLFALAAGDNGGLERIDANSTGPAWQRQPGFNDQGVRDALVNVARSESDPEVATELFTASRPAGTTAIAGLRSDSPDGMPLWQWLALAALLLFILESIICRLLDRNIQSGQES